MRNADGRRSTRSFSFHLALRLLSLPTSPPRYLVSVTHRRHCAAPKRLGANSTTPHKPVTLATLPCLVAHILSSAQARAPRTGAATTRLASCALSLAKTPPAAAIRRSTFALQVRKRVRMGGRQGGQGVRLSKRHACNSPHFPTLF